MKGGQGWEWEMREAARFRGGRESMTWGVYREREQHRATWGSEGETLVGNIIRERPLIQSLVHSSCDGAKKLRANAEWTYSDTVQGVCSKVPGWWQLTYRRI